MTEAGKALIARLCLHCVLHPWATHPVLPPVFSMVSLVAHMPEEVLGWLVGWFLPAVYCLPFSR